jgi:hypothetical protein
MRLGVCPRLFEGRVSMSKDCNVSVQLGSGSHLIDCCHLLCCM